MIDKRQVILVGREFMPAVIGYLAYPTTEVTLVHTKQNDNQIDNLADFFYSRGVENVESFEVDPFDPVKLTAQVEECYSDTEYHRQILNFTGGTKIMSLLFFAGAMAKNIDSFYTDSQQQQILRNHNGKWVDPQPFPKIDLKIEEWLQINGYQKFESVEPSALSDLEVLSTWLFNERSESSKQLKRFTDFVQGVIFNRNENQASIGNHLLGGLVIESDSNKEVFVSLNGVVFESRNSSWWFQYFSSGWFEHWLYLQALKFGNFDQLLLNLRVRNKSNQDLNEIDLIGIKDGYINIFEAKLGGVDQYDIIKLDSLKRLYASLYSSITLVKWFPFNARENHIKSKVEALNIKVLTGGGYLKKNLISYLHNVDHTNL